MNRQPNKEKKYYESYPILVEICEDFPTKRRERGTEFLFLVDNQANAYTSIPEGWQLMGLDAPEERGDVVGFLDGKRYLFEGGSNKLLIVAEE